MGCTCRPIFDFRAMASGCETFDEGPPSSNIADYDALEKHQQTHNGPNDRNTADIEARKNEVKYVWAALLVAYIDVELVHSLYRFRSVLLLRLRFRSLRHRVELGTT